MRTTGDILRPLLLCLMLMGCSEVAPTTPAASPPKDQLVAVYVRADDVFATTDSAIFRAKLRDRRWKKVSVSSAPPPGGQFARTDSPSRDVIYFMSKGRVATASPAARGKPGLYR